MIDKLKKLVIYSDIMLTLQHIHAQNGEVNLKGFKNFLINM